MCKFIDNCTAYPAETDWQIDTLSIYLYSYSK